MEHKTCEHCKEPVISELTEPEGKTLLFNPAKRSAWKLVAVAGVHTIMAPVEVYDLHRLTCKAINNKE